MYCSRRDWTGHTSLHHRQNIVDIESVDIFIQPPDCESGYNAEDSGDEICESLDNLSGYPLDIVVDVILYKNKQKDQIIEAESAEDEETSRVVSTSANTENALNVEGLLKDTTVVADKEIERKKMVQKRSARERRRNLHRMEP